MKVGIVVFPGSNCDRDTFYAASSIMKFETRYIWHKESSLDSVDLVILPGGFSYGDYLRCGAIARFSPIMKDVIHFAKKGGLVLGICNGFQILTECGLLPGVLLRNASLKFICRRVQLCVENKKTLFTSEYKKNEIITIPIRHGDGNYFTDEQTFKTLQDKDQIIFRYCSRDGVVDEKSNPNGSLGNIAGIINKQGNILGMMPHPENASDAVLKMTDGKKLFDSILKNFKN